MTDKQIIIDGVNVSGCEKQGETIAGITCGNGERIRLANEIITKHKLCKDNPNCVYKQLKRKEQECEALQISENEAGEIIAELKAYKDVNEDFKTAWKELKSENEELKKIINEAKNSNLDLKSFLVGEEIQNEYEQQLDKLKQTLAEIKEIAEVEIECKTYEIENDCFNETRCKALNEHIDFIKQILQIISESEVNQ